jgi:hypothetical protein
MPGAKKPSVNPGMSDAAVAAKTGKTWAEWVRALNAAGAARMTHREIAQHLGKKLGVRSWWSQMVTVGYERLTGRREKGQTTGGYSVSASRRMGVSVERLFAAWQNAGERRRWLRGDKLEVSKATRPKSVRGAWGGGRSRVAIGFYPKGAKKSAVALEHSKLGSAGGAARMKTYWGKQLDALEGHLASLRG